MADGGVEHGSAGRSEMAVPQALVRVLEEAGIEFVFGMPGGDTGRIFDAFYDSSKIRAVLVRHEQVGSISTRFQSRRSCSTTAYRAG